MGKRQVPSICTHCDDGYCLDTLLRPPSILHRLTIPYHTIVVLLQKNQVSRRQVLQKDDTSRTAFSARLRRDACGSNTKCGTCRCPPCCDHTQTAPQAAMHSLGTVARVMVAAPHHHVPGQVVWVVLCLHRQILPSTRCVHCFATDHKPSSDIHEWGYRQGAWLK